MTDKPRHPNIIIDDLGFRMAWLEKTALMNIRKLEEIAARTLATPEDLRTAISDLVDDTKNSLIELQVSAVERLLIRQRPTADVLPFTPPTSEKLPRPGLVPA